MASATLSSPANTALAAASAKEALRILEQAWAYFTPETPAVPPVPAEPRDRHDAVQLFAYYRPGL